MSSAGIAVSHLQEDPTLSLIRSDGARSPHCAVESILIYLSFSSGSAVMPMRVLASESIASMKLRIQSCKGFVVKKQKLIFDGRELSRNECLISDYGVGNGNILHLNLRLSDLRDIVVKTTFGREYKFLVQQTKNIGFIKEQIAKERNGQALPHEQKLICNGQELDDQCLIEDISSDKNAIIHLFVCKSSKIRSKQVVKDLELSIETKEPVAGCALLEPIIVNPKVELPAVIHEMIHATVAGLEKGNVPVRTSEGSGGAYFMGGGKSGSDQKYVTVFKPIDEEPMAVNNPQGLPVSVDGEGLKKGTRVGEGALREVAAYILDHPIGVRRSFTSYGASGFAGVPPTVLARCLNEGFNHPGGFSGSSKNIKIGSLQMFMENIGTCEDMGPRIFPLDDVHRISVLDIRLANADRHGGNILVCRTGDDHQIRLVPIDHGYCLPENVSNIFSSILHNFT